MQTFNIENQAFYGKRLCPNWTPNLFWVWLKAFFFSPISVPFLKYLAKISFNRKMTRLVCSPWFNNFPRNDFWMIFRMFLMQKNWGGGGRGYWEIWKIGSIGFKGCWKLNMKKKISRQIPDSPPPQGASHTISGLTLRLCVYHLFYPNSFRSLNNIIPPKYTQAVPLEP